MSRRRLDAPPAPSPPTTRRASRAGLARRACCRSARWPPASACFRFTRWRRPRRRRRRASAAAASAPRRRDAAADRGAGQGRDRPELGARDHDDGRPRQPGHPRHPAVGHRDDREADRRPPRRHPQARRCTTPPASPSRPPRAASRTSACAASRSPRAATSTSTACATRRSTTATPSTSTGSR